jgi:hypothetical protein
MEKDRFRNQLRIWERSATGGVVCRLLLVYKKDTSTEYVEQR